MELVYAGLHQLLTPMLGRLELLPGASGRRAADGVRPRAPGRRRTGSWSGWPPWACWPTWPRSTHWSAWSTTRSGWIAPRPRFSRSTARRLAGRIGRPGLRGPRPGRRPGGVAGAGGRAACGRPMRAPCWTRCSPGRWIRGSATGSWPRPLATRWRCSSCPGGWPRPSWPAGSPSPDAMPLSGRIEESFRRRLEVLPADSRRLLQLAAAEPVGDPVLMWRAAERLGIAAQAATPAAEAGLMEIGARVLFRHPLVRSAAYRSASLQERQRGAPCAGRGHRPGARPRPPGLALGPGRARARRGRRRRAGALGRPGAGPRRTRGGGRVPAARGRAHRGPGRAGSSGRSPRPTRASRPGSFDAARTLIAAAEGGALDEFQRARVDLLRAEVALASSRGTDAAPLLLQAASRLEPLDLDLARETYLIAWGAASVRCHGSTTASPSPRSRGPHPGHPAARADLPARRPAARRAVASSTTRGAAAAPRRCSKRRRRCRRDRRWRTSFAGAGWPRRPATRVGRRVCVLAIPARVSSVRDAGALAQLPLHLSAPLALARVCGDLRPVPPRVAEIDSVVAATGSRVRAVRRAAPRRLARAGQPSPPQLIDDHDREAGARGEGMALAIAQ